LDRHLLERITKRLENLEQNLFPSDAKFIGREDSEKVFRYRIGDHRVLYSVDENKKIILIMKIDKRPRVYDR
jgi:mRNA interferase RelE/StbE